MTHAGLSASSNGSAMNAACLGRERAGRGPEAVAVELDDVAAPLLGRVELRRERVGVAALTQEVVGRLADLA